MCGSGRRLKPFPVERSCTCSSGRRLKGNVYRLLGPVLLEWVEANEPKKDLENWSRKCVLRWKKKTKQPHSRTKQQRTEKPRKNAVCRTSVRPCALLILTQEYTLAQL